MGKDKTGAEFTVYIRERNIRIEKFCDICGSKFTIPPCWEGRVKRCSLKCKHKAMEGKNNWNYKNGKTVSKYGYILINNYPFKIFEHRKIVAFPTTPFPQITASSIEIAPL